ncbi:MAG: isoprenoid biosynthesis glyoxalase ElbB [Bacteroidales bacterium]|nr:isoprenoid biosynthesis glyoxalase ElbB [Bacteroidales bacterium]
MSAKKIAVILSGSGVYDGAEIHEAVMSLYAIDLLNCTYQIFAPDIKQHHVVNHITGDEMPESRNVLIESARIARGNIKELSEYKVADFDGLLFPGGFGVAKNLSTFAFDGPDCQVNPDTENAIRTTHRAGKPIGALCISPVVIAKVLQDVKVTIGQDPATSEAIVKMGGNALKTHQREIVIDQKNKIVTNPCYMLDSSIVDIAEGAKNTVKAMLDLM